MRLIVRRIAFAIVVAVPATVFQVLLVFGVPLIALFEFIDGGSEPFRTAWRELVVDGPAREVIANWPR